jgi:NACalpha-BTF3-like transcription factor
MTHRGTYCKSHIVNHENKTFDFLKKSTRRHVVRYTDHSVKYIPKTAIFFEEDVELVSQQAGVDREKARNALIEAKGDLARAILLLITG